MKDSYSAAIAVAFLAVAAGRLYRKYFGKDKVNPEKSIKKSSPFSSSLKEDDYEPYSKK